MAADTAGSTVCDSCRGCAGGDAECDGIDAIVTNGTLTWYASRRSESSGATHGNTNVNAHTTVVSVTEATVSATRRAVTTHTTSRHTTTSCPQHTTHKNTQHKQVLQTGCVAAMATGHSVCMHSKVSNRFGLSKPLGLRDFVGLLYTCQKMLFDQTFKSKSRWEWTPRVQASRELINILIFRVAGCEV
jgi:hypothetical protein